MLTGARLRKLFLAVTLLISASLGGATTQASAPAQGDRTVQSSDALVESLEGAVSEGNNEKAHDLLLQILKRPHLTSDFLLRVGIQLAQRELYEDAAETFHRCIQEHPEVFEAYYNLALADIAQQNWETALAVLQQAPRQSKAEVLGKDP
jgi:tetratricopeptide (TPR) repeat protein